jgi:hypothetical protein
MNTTVSERAVGETGTAIAKLAIERLSIMAPISEYGLRHRAAWAEMRQTTSVTDNFEAWCIESGLSYSKQELPKQRTPKQE